MKISETILLLIIALISAIAALLCVIGLATPNWAWSSLTWYGLWCTGCSHTSGALAIIAFLLLLISVVLLILLAIKILPNGINFLPFIILFIASIFSLASFASYYVNSSYYSYNLVVAAHFFTYTSAVLLAFWLGGKLSIVNSN
ncbi:unnamed protein product [Didymodactylos carnosus]|uniref:Uncharacterized protein n=1 Tax=Didymodactylos carnosus TaxID=1234261 RepID=A0A815UEM4_9BILA|nr:unnamed protein product [Didymodactylos carnosus]CAF1518452.1 unnamed protein product [Didymodactylos carnosus]CAF4174286.1 unnamed protein product [Didymodactylos carnosus]CAF4378215.1 unnamed protein product [Didymodactylos carnosus]